MKIDIEAARQLHRRLHTMPKPARQFAFNLIELIEGNVLEIPPVGDHDIQRQEKRFEYQMQRLEQALMEA